MSLDTWINFNEYSPTTGDTFLALCNYEDEGEIRTLKPLLMKKEFHRFVTIPFDCCNCLNDIEIIYWMLIPLKDKK